MARKSNKTAHVLNLLAGHDTQPAADETPDTKKSAETQEDTTTDTSSEKIAPADSDSDAIAGPSAAPAQSISVIDTTGADPVADLIQQKLSAQFEDSQDALSDIRTDDPTTGLTADPLTGDLTTGLAADPLTGDLTTGLAAEESTAPISSAIAADAYAVEAADESFTGDAAVDSYDSAESGQSLIPEGIPADADTEATAVPTPEPVHAPAQVSVPTPDPVPSMPIPEPESVPGPGPTTVPKKEPETPSEPAPEPDFIYLNVMETIVRDKIIYFMRQFDVCTCDRCVADTVALTMNGLTPRYIVTSPAAVDPLIGFYTNKLISDITVEATKACMVVKDNPRHSS